MKKSTLLSFATAAAIVATSAGTYAAWDKTSDVKTMDTKVTIRQKVSTTVNSTASFTASATDLTSESGPTYTAEVPVTVSDIPTDALNKYQLEVRAYAFDTQQAATAAVGDPTTLETTKSTETAAEVATDDATTEITTADTTKNVTVTVKPTSTATGDAAKDAYVVVKAEIVKKPTV